MIQILLGSKISRIVYYVYNIEIEYYRSRFGKLSIGCYHIRHKSYR